MVDHNISAGMEQQPQKICMLIFFCLACYKIKLNLNGSSIPFRLDDIIRVGFKNMLKTIYHAEIIVLTIIIKEDNGHKFSTRMVHYGCDDLSYGSREILA